MKKTEHRAESFNLYGWLIFIGLSVFLPAVIFYAASSYVASVSAENRLRRYQIEASDILEQLRLSSDSGFYLCNRISEIFNRCADDIDLQRSMTELNLELGGSLDFLVWKKDGSIASATFAWQHYEADWKMAFASLFNLGVKGQETITEPETANLRKIYGPQFFPQMHASCYSGRTIKPLPGDSSLKKRPVWVRAGDRFGLSVFLPYELLDAPISDWQR
jgi:hypothetical protein